MSFICTLTTAWIMRHDDFVKNWLIQLKIFTYFSTNAVKLNSYFKI